MRHQKREAAKDFLWFYRKQAVLLCSILTVIGALLAAGLTTRGEAAGIQRGIASEILRFHVIANSDSREDQALKLEVRDAVVEYMEGFLGDAQDVGQTKSLVEAHMAEIEKRAAEVIGRAGYTYPAKAELAECYFPRKSYGDCTFPAGRYQALRVRIGKAAGRNWWCVLFPNLCFIDSIHAVLPKEQKQQLKNVLTEEEYESLFDWKHNKFIITFHLFE